ncbi:hypothetical protein PTSG_08622 [Salpingoeca rosetta]|uniref:V-type proton ATPase subunit H n=1 Tax=Salpingoeca rosetta (strain ATCC 50818 / BSB-021) TaxID=946362 RepID=F2UK75_SALR5|nr:uncharacterized protein PTSG_08622 [Salpingoeca rosetta]EGD77524.1 hypothetical protein PTSG_08622 [Salpingoeca rosetta]|eukprot:XP_004990412.1 hypothetical protein PTSG_08622 [Salpingoeca rosetta]
MVFETIPIAPEGTTSNSILDERVQIHGTRMDWGSLGVLNVVDPDGLLLMQEYDVPDKGSRLHFIEESGRDIMRVLLELYMHVVAEDRLKYIVTTFDRIAEDDPSTTDLLIEVAGTIESAPPSPLHPFLQKLEMPSLYIAHQSSRVIARLIEHGAPYEDKHIQTYLNWLQKQLSHQESSAVRLALAAVVSVLKVPRNRPLVAHSRSFLDALKSLLHPSGHFQILYQTLACLWMLTFDASAVQSIRFEVLHSLAITAVEIVKEAKKEKVTRVAFAFLRNCVENLEAKQSLELSIAMVTHKLLPVVERLHRAAAHEDEELAEDVEFLLEKLRSCHDHMSSFDEYVAEVRSGELEWTPVHRSKKFWAENVLKFNDNKHELLKTVVSCLTSNNPQTLAVAVHDCGQYVSHYPFGKKVLEDLSAKSKIIALMEHEDKQVKFEALIAVQKMVSDNWEFLGAQTKKAAEGSA